MYCTPMSGSYLFMCSNFDKFGTFGGKKQLFFWADMAGLGKYCTDGYGQIGVCRVKALLLLIWMFVGSQLSCCFCG